MMKLQVIDYNNNKLNGSVNSYCGYCNKEIGLDIYLKVGTKDYSYGEKDYYYVGLCPICGKPIIHKIADNSTLPLRNYFSHINNLPENIDKLYDEIINSYSIGAYTCSVLLSRTLLEHVSVEYEGEVGKTFTYYVDYLYNQFFLNMPNSKNWIDKIRTVANESAHKLYISNEHDAKTVIVFLTNILNYLYVLPNQVGIVDEN